MIAQKIAQNSVAKCLGCEKLKHMKSLIPFRGNTTGRLIGYVCGNPEAKLTTGANPCHTRAMRKYRNSSPAIPVAKVPNKPQFAVV